MPERKVELFLGEEGDIMSLNPWGSKTASQSGKCQVSGEWRVEKSQDGSGAVPQGGRGSGLGGEWRRASIIE